MSGGVTCRNKDHHSFWVVLQRNHNASAFNGYRPQNITDLVRRHPANTTETEA